MTHWRSLMDRDYLGAWDVPTDKVAEILSVNGVKLDGAGGIKPSRKPVIAFRGTEKKLIAGATICKTIESLYGKNYEGWIGKKIVLYATECPSKGGEMVDCVRVRNFIPKEKAAPIPSQPVDQAMRSKQRAGAGETTDDPAREPGED